METNRTLEIIRNEIERRIIYAIGFRDNVEQEERASFFNGEAVALKHLLSFLDTLEAEKPMQEGLEEEINRYLREECSDDDEPGIHELAEHFAQWGAEHLAGARKMIEPEKKEGRTDCSPQGEVPDDSLATQSYENIPNDLEEAANKFAVFYDQGTCDGIAQDCFIAGAKWQAEQLLKSSPLPEDTVLFNKGVAEGRRLAEEEQADLFTIVALDAAQRAKEQMMKEAVEGIVTESYGYEKNEDGEWGQVVSPIIRINVEKYSLGDKVRVIVLPKED